MSIKKTGLKITRVFIAHLVIHIYNLSSIKSRFYVQLLYNFHILSYIHIFIYSEKSCIKIKLIKNRVKKSLMKIGLEIKI